MAREYTKRTEFGITKIFLNGTVVATFAGDDDGDFAYQMFLHGTARNTKDTIFDENLAQYVVGDLDKMVG